MTMVYKCLLTLPLESVSTTAQEETSIASQISRTRYVFVNALMEHSWRMARGHVLRIAQRVSQILKPDIALQYVLLIPMAT